MPKIPGGKFISRRKVGAKGLRWRLGSFKRIRGRGLNVKGKKIVIEKKKEFDLFENSLEGEEE